MTDFEKAVYARSMGRCILGELLWRKHGIDCMRFARQRAYTLLLRERPVTISPKEVGDVCA